MELGKRCLDLFPSVFIQYFTLIPCYISLKLGVKPLIASYQQEMVHIPTLVKSTWKCAQPDTLLSSFTITLQSGQGQIQDLARGGSSLKQLINKMHKHTFFIKSYEKFFLFKII